MAPGSSTIGNGAWTYTPDANDDTGRQLSPTRSATATSPLPGFGGASLDITSVNDAPETTSAVTLNAIAENSGARIVAQAELLPNASDIEGDALPHCTPISPSFPANGELLDNGDGTWTYTPAAHDDTSVVFSYAG